MRSRIVQLFILTALIMSGCFPSLYPLYTEDDIFFDSKILGIWSESDDQMCWIFEQGNRTDSYQLTILDDGEKSYFEAHLLTLENWTFLDLYPQDLDHESSFYESHFIKAHTFYRIRRIEGLLEIWMIDHEWLQRQIESNTLELDVFELKNGIYLTVSETERLQEFMLYNMESPEFWDEPTLLIQR